MLERIKRALGIGVPEAETPESFDHPRPRRANANPPQHDWFARVRAASLAAQDARANGERRSR